MAALDQGVALTRIAQLLRLPQWPGAEMLEWIAEIVEEAGFDIVNGQDCDGNLQGTAKVNEAKNVLDRLEAIEEWAAEGGRFSLDAPGEGVAWRFKKRDTMYVFDSEEQGETGMVVMVMVGDDSPFVVDPEDVHAIDTDSYCHSCGQIGCGHDGRTR